MNFEPLNPDRSFLNRLCGALIETSWLFPVLLIPLIRNLHAIAAFEPTKIIFIRCFALLALAAACARITEERPAFNRRIKFALENSGGVNFFVGPDIRRRYTCLGGAVHQHREQLLGLIRIPARSLHYTFRSLYHGIDRSESPDQKPN